MQLNSFFKTAKDWNLLKHKTLYEELNINGLKKELVQIRETKNINAISKKEKEIILKILEVVEKYPYKEEFAMPSDIKNSQYINCVGASELGGSLLSEVGIDYGVVSMPEHSVLITAVSDGNVVLTDMLSSSRNILLTDGFARDKNNLPVKVKDVFSFIKGGAKDKLSFVATSQEFRDKYSWVSGNEIFNLEILPKEVGHRVQTLNWFSSFLYERGDLDNHVVEICNQILSLDPDDFQANQKLGIVLRRLNRLDDSIIHYKKCISLDPFFSASYFGLAKSFEAYNKKEDAIKTYQKFIELADPKEDGFSISIARNRIISLMGAKNNPPR